MKPICSPRGSLLFGDAMLGGCANILQQQMNRGSRARHNTPRRRAMATGKLLKTKLREQYRDHRLPTA